MSIIVPTTTDIGKIFLRIQKNIIFVKLKKKVFLNNRSYNFLQLTKDKRTSSDSKRSRNSINRERESMSVVTTGDTIPDKLTNSYYEM